MRKIFAALLFLSSPLFAAPKANVGVFSSVKVETANGGINPAFSGIKLSGTIQAGNNGCEAARYKVSVKKQVVDGVLTFSATKRLVKNTICPLFIEPGFLGVKFENTFVVEGALLDTAVIKNVEELGNDLSVASFFGEVETPAATGCENAFESTICTMEFDPSTCSYKGFSASGNNRCGASANLRREVCSAEGSINIEEVVCASNSSSEI